MKVRSPLIGWIVLLMYAFDAAAMGHACFYDTSTDAAAPDPTLFSEQYNTVYDEMQFQTSNLLNCFHVTFTNWHDCTEVQRAVMSPGYALVLVSTNNGDDYYYMDSHYNALGALCDPEFGPECMYFYWPGPNSGNYHLCDNAWGFIDFP
jgi:hypothetical protein